MSVTSNNGSKGKRDIFADNPSNMNSEVLGQLSAFHKAQLLLCDRLEELADSLPDSFDAQKALIVARQILSTVKQAHRFEEETLFDLLPMNQSNTKQSVERLKFEHWEDEASAEDLTEALFSYARDAKPEVAGKLAYMLRGFFDNLRRHIAFENEHILPLVIESGQYDAHH